MRQEKKQPVKTLENGLKDLDEYLARYCKQYKVSIEEAVSHKVVQLVARHYGVTIDNYLFHKNGDSGE